jgi:hypothetical protein
MLKPPRLGLSSWTNLSRRVKLGVTLVDDIVNTAVREPVRDRQRFRWEGTRSTHETPFVRVMVEFLGFLPILTKDSGFAVGLFGSQLPLLSAVGRNVETYETSAKDTDTPETGGAI